MNIEQITELKEKYFVSENGTVTNRKTGKVRSQIIASEGRCIYTFNSIYSTVSKSRLIKLYYDWVENNEGLDVHHINGDHSDDRLENLQWITKEEHMVLHIDIKRSKTLRQESKIVHDIKNGMSRKDVREKYDTYDKAISLALKANGLPLDYDKILLKQNMIEMFKNGSKMTEIRTVLNIGSSTATRWIKNYKDELKTIIPTEYNKGGISQRAIAKKYCVSHPTVLKYVKEYNTK